MLSSRGRLLSGFPKLKHRQKVDDVASVETSQGTEGRKYLFWLMVSGVWLCKEGKKGGRTLGQLVSLTASSLGEERWMLVLIWQSGPQPMAWCCPYLCP